MTLKECYESMGLPYDTAIGRLGSDAVLKRFVLKFLDDKSFSELEEGITAGDGEKAFRAAHTLKGICLNLSFDNLFRVSSELTEKLRGRETSGSEELFEAVKSEYVRLTDAIRSLD